ncbi:MAG TPA: potassium channel family protein [Terriglobia bacterium]|nr:potassium channel family protein [Terriglobia bacterium]
MPRLLNPEQRSLFLLLSVLAFFILTPFLEGNRTGELFIVLVLYLTLIAATAELHEKRVLFRTAIPIAAASMVLLGTSHFHPIPVLMLAGDVVLAGFLCLVSVSLFAYLGQPGAITKGRLYVSVALYLLIGLSWFVLYQIVDVLQPGSFAEAGVTLTGRILPSKLLYFSLVSLTTLGYGDILAVRPVARITAALEAVAGVLYIAITVARLVAGYQASDHK